MPLTQMILVELEKLRQLTRVIRVALVVKNPTANAGHIRDVELISGSRRSPGDGNGNPLQYSCLENPIDRGVLEGYSPWVCKSQT